MKPTLRGLIKQLERKYGKKFVDVQWEDELENEVDVVIHDGENQRVIEAVLTPEEVVRTHSVPLIPGTDGRFANGWGETDLTNTTEDGYYWPELKITFKQLTELS